MKTAKRQLGDRGENAAAAYLKKKHLRIRERNFTSGKNEIDIIAEDRHTIVFVEVKTRTNKEYNMSRFGLPRCAVDYRKRHCLFACASAYLAYYKPKKQIRFDVVEVYVTADDPPVIEKIEHLPDAFRP